MTKTIEKILIANRGEIARRIMRTCRKLGIATVAVYSDADQVMPFVAEADEAVLLGPAPSVQSYLCIDKIVEAAALTGSDAIHPGYGFLAENAEFAEACHQAGLIFIGPTPEAVVAMGSKREAKALVHAAGVPVIPGYDGASQDPAVLASEAIRIGFPVLLKASAGGGGKGMKLVRRESELSDAIASAAREGLSAFGDGTLLVEKYIDDPRHVEIQILGDSHGNLIHLNERECSIQRRHQKIIEETPSPALDPALRERMGGAAVRCGSAIGYQNAGTVEFILAPDRSFYFLEVNTRLQVEHPITECVTGLDLVEEQIRIAQGEPLRLSQDQVRMEGAALEVRLYAEDPAAGFLPQSGTVVDWHLPSAEGLRVDSGVESGSEVSIHYDPMLAKIITSGESRTSALQRMRHALRALSVQGVTTNRELLLRILDHPAYVAGEIDTHFIDRHLRDVLPDTSNGRAEEHAAVVAALAEQQQRNRDRALLPEIPSGWRNNYHTPQWIEYSAGDRDFRVEYRHHGENRFTVWSKQSERAVRVVSWDPPWLVWEEGRRRQHARVVFHGERVYVHGSDFSLGLLRKPRFPDKSLAIPPGGCVAPMPGKVIELRVAEGDTVETGQVLLIMEAMKMEHSVTAPQNGTVARVTVALGDQVDADALLIVVAEP
ncbi:MAG: acetyl-CoA carboxylase biotin carboxylase subunit [Polyangiales bacterium]